MLLRIMPALLVVLVAGCAARGGGPADTNPTTADLAAARALFQANLAAIRNRDREAYLATYLRSEHMARGGPEGLELGFDPDAATADDTWPDDFEVRDLQLVPVADGVVYGMYRYRVRYGDTENTGRSARIFRATDNGWRIAVTNAFPGSAAPPGMALVGATLVDGTGAAPVEDAVVVVRNGEIECAGSREDCAVPDDLVAVNLAGHWITPGLVDAHIHHAQTGWADGRPDALDLRERFPYTELQARLREHPERWHRSYLCSGVTGVFDVGGYPWSWAIRDRTADSTLAPHVAAAGPLLSTLDFWLNLPAERQFIYLEDEQAAHEGVAYLADAGADAVKVWFIAVGDRDRDAMDAAVMAAGEAADKAGLPLIVHATGLREAKVALRAGAEVLVHSVWDRRVDDEFIRLMRQNDTIYTPTLKVGAGYLRMYRAAVDGTAPRIDDPNDCVDVATRKKIAATAELSRVAGAKLPDKRQLERRRQRLRERTRIGALNLERVNQAGIDIAMGTDAGNPLTLHGPSVYAEMEAMQAAGMTPLQVLESATRVSAQAMGRDEIGTLEAGKAADLLILDADPISDIANMRKLDSVMRGGELRSVRQLSALVKGER